MHTGRRVSTITAAALLAAALGSGTANAQVTDATETTTSAADPGTTQEKTTIVVNGKKIPAIKTTGTYVLTPGEGGAGATWPTTPPPGEVTTNIVWGSSYSISSERVQFIYTGSTWAAANIYNNRRIIQTCFWYTQDQRRSATTCSNADSSTRVWRPGPVNRASFQDTLNPVAPQTQFHFSKYDVDPAVTPR